MSSNTRQTIIDGARLCFFKHGFRASNMSLISQFAGFSRVTLHKHFKNKERVFREVCNNYKINCINNCKHELTQNYACWDMIERITESWNKSAFEEVSDNRVLRELIFEASQVAQDIFEDAKNANIAIIQRVLEKGIQDTQINLQACQLSSEELATMIVACVNGIRSNYPREQIRLACHQQLTLLRLATQV
jgi:AcrR family transcriptional regulator